jgi:DNA-binding response OmpR family regulator
LFSCTFPGKPTAEAKENTLPANGGNGVTTKQILIVDDEPSQHFLLESQLKLSGYEVQHAYTGQEALSKLTDQQVDLIILDVNMPGMDGFQTLKRLREQNGQDDIPVIFLSSLDRQYLKVKGLEGGADDYLTKPVDTAELTSRIKARLRRSIKRTQEQPAQAAGTMQGDFQSMDLSDLVQSMSFFGKTCTITLPDIDGVIAVKEGTVIGIRQGDFYGKEAFLRLLLLQKGRFIVTFEELVDLGEEDSMNVGNLLLSGVSEADEIRDNIQKLGSTDMLVSLKNSAAPVPGTEEFMDKFPLPLLTVITRMTGTLKENVDIMQTVLAQGIVTLESA